MLITCLASSVSNLHKIKNLHISFPQFRLTVLKRAIQILLSIDENIQLQQIPLSSNYNEKLCTVIWIKEWVRLFRD